MFVLAVCATAYVAMAAAMAVFVYAGLVRQGYPPSAVRMNWIMALFPTSDSWLASIPTGALHRAISFSSMNGGCG